MIEIQLPDGATLLFPEGTDPAKIKAAAQKAAAPRQRMRTVVQGASLGTGDEIEARARSLMPGSPPYREIRDDIRGQLADYRRDYPLESTAYEVGGAVLPTAAMALSGAGAPAAAMNTARLARLAQMAKVGATEGAVAGYGYSDSDTVKGQASDTVAGAGIGTVISPAVGTAAEAVGGLAKGLINQARTMMGDRATTAVQAELQRLAEGTGKSMDEVVADVMEGRIMAENRTLNAVVRAYKSGGGKPGAFVENQAAARRGQTRQDALDTLQEGFAPGTQGNVYAAQRYSDDELKALEKEEYARVFGDRADLAPQVTETLADILQRMPEARTEIAKIYGNSRRLAPLFVTKENGAIELYRVPSVEDAEIVRRALADETSKAYRAGSGTLAGEYSEAEKALRGQLDINYPELDTVRQNASRRRTISDKFDEGRKVFNLPSDELEVVVADLMKLKNPEALEAFRAGAMDAIRNKANKPGNFMYRMGSENTRERSLIELLYPSGGAENALHKTNIAGEAHDMANYVIRGSPTQNTQAAERKIGSRGSLEDTARMMQGDPMAIIGGIQRALASATPGLNDRQRMEVVKVLFSQDPDFVRRALTDDTLTAELVKRASRIVGGLADGGRRATVAQSADLVGGLYDQMMTPPEANSGP